MRRVCLLGLALTAACSDALEQTSSAGQVIGVVNAADNTVSFVSATDFSVRTVGLATPGGAATTAAGRGGTVIVPLGPADSVAVIHNAGLCTTGLCVRPVVVFALPRGSGATGAAIRDDSIAWVANPNLNTVTRSEEHTSDSSHRTISYAVFCLKKKNKNNELLPEDRSREIPIEPSYTQLKLPRQPPVSLVAVPRHKH